MISIGLFQFLKALKANNDKIWFDANRSVYNEIRKEFEQFVNVVIGEIARFD
jgi:uncharacterized protein (DUF2461 family)